MDKTKKIKMPEPIHIKKINTKLDFFSNTNVIRQWSGYDVIDTLFYLYLFNKYKQNCLIKYKGASSKHSLGLELQIKTNLSRSEYSVYEKHLQMVSIKLSECIEKNPDSIVIPLYIKKSDGGHANILIYRKKDNVIEHFEPHGSKIITRDPQNNQLIETQLNLFIAMLNEQLKKNNKPPVNLIPSNTVCPYIYGLQGLEEKASQKKSALEGGGYCAAWSMFFTELVLKNPTIPSDELLNIIINKFDKDIEKQRIYLRKVIIGYVNLIHNKIEKYFYFITGVKNSVDKINEMIKANQTDNFIANYNTIINIQTELFNNSSLTKKGYIEILEKKKLNTKNPDQKLEIDREIYFLNQMDQISVSPVSSNINSSKSSSSSSSKKKKKGKNNKTKKLTPIKKIINCPQGSQINPETGRCNKIKVYPTCPPTRNPITNRCKTII